jgi:hypothetical protein
MPQRLDPIDLNVNSDCLFGYRRWYIQAGPFKQPGQTHRPHGDCQAQNGIQKTHAPSSLAKLQGRTSHRYQSTEKTGRKSQLHRLHINDDQHGYVVDRRHGPIIPPSSSAGLWQILLKAPRCPPSSVFLTKPSRLLRAGIIFVTRCCVLAGYRNHKIRLTNGPGGV